MQVNAYKQWMHSYRVSIADDGAGKGWNLSKLDKNIPLYFQKVLPIDDRFILLIGGSKKANLFDNVDKSPEYTLYLLSIGNEGV